LSNEFKINEVDKHVYVKHTDKDHIIIYLYMDVMLILNDNDYMIISNKKKLPSKFNKKDLTVTDIILGIKIT
jgi:hypothetical protein